MTVATYFGTQNDYLFAFYQFNSEQLVSAKPGTVDVADAQTGGNQLTMTVNGSAVTSITVAANSIIPAAQIDSPNADGAVWVSINGGPRVRAVPQGQRGATGDTGPKGDPGPPGPGTGAGAWQPSTAYTAGQVVQAPDGSIISRTSSGTSRASFDATEQAAWQTVSSKSGTMEQVALSAAFAAMAPKPTGVAATDTANLTDLANSLASTGGLIRLHEGTYVLNAPLPVLAGVQWEGVTPALRQENVTTGTWLADGPWDYAGGTVFQGDGTFAAFEANTTDQATLPASLGTTETPGFGAVGIGFDNFTYGVHVGAKNIMGLSHGLLDRLFFKRCSQWGVKIVNFAHMTFGDLRCYTIANNGSVGALFFGVDMPVTTFQPGNSRFGELYAYIPASSPHTRGIQFHARGDSGGGSLAHVTGQRLQSNRFGTTEITDTATFINGSANITVGNGAQFVVGQPITFDATVAGFTAALIYRIASVSGNTITVAHDSYSAAVVANAAGSANIASYGMPNIEWTVGESGSYHTTPQFLNLDSEGVVSVGLYAEAIRMGWFSMGVRTQGCLANVCLRDVEHSEVRALQDVTLDADDNSASSAFFGERAATRGVPLRGLWYDTGRGTNVLGIGNGGSNSALNKGDIEVRLNGFLYPQFGVGERYLGSNDSLTFYGFECGNIIFAGGTAVTYTLPTITTDTPTSGGSPLGLWYEFVNVGTANITVNTDGTQLFNKVAGKTALTIAPQTALKVVAVADVNRNYFWVAMPTTALA